MMSQNAMPSEPSSMTPQRCTPAGVLIVPLVPLVQSLGAVCAQRSGMTVQGPPLLAVSVPPCLYKSRGGHPCPVTPGALAPQLVGASGQLGREQALPCAENLFSWYGVRLGEYDGVVTNECAQSVLNCLSSFRGRTVVPLKHFQRLLGHMASTAAVTLLGLLHMRPLQHWLHSHEMGIVLWRTSRDHHINVLPHVQSLSGPCLFTGRGALRTSVLACRGHDGFLQCGLGS